MNARKALAYATKKYRYLRADPRFFWMSSVARFERVRDWATRPRFRGDQFVAFSSLVRADHYDAEVLNTLRADGYYVGLRLAPTAVAELMACARGTICYGDRDPNIAFMPDDRAEVERRLGRRFRLANHFDQQLAWPVFGRLVHDPWLRAMVGAYLGREPRFLRSEVLWTFATPATFEQRRGAAQVLHCDINDYKTLKVFFYLTDVGLTNGPHQYVKKGPTKRTLLHQVLGQRCASIPDEQLLRTYAFNELTTVCGRAGTGFVGDPYYFHRGTIPTEGTRVMVQLEFGCHAYRTWYFDAYA